MREIVSRFSLYLSLTAVLIVSGCSKQPNTPTQPGTSSAPPAQSLASPQTLKSPLTMNTRGAAIQAAPNPIQLCDGSGLGITTLYYKFLPPVKVVDVRVGSPSGPQMAHSTIEMSSTTGKWVADGTVFYLQDVSDGKSLTPENTLATVTVKLTNAGCR